MSTNCDVVVVGGGPVGLAAAYQVAARGLSVVVLEQFTFFNQLGSSAGVSRQFRLPYPEQYMVELVKASVPFWDELQAQTPRQLRDVVGTLWFGDPKVKSTEGNIAAAEQALEASGVRYSTVDSHAIEQMYNFRDLPPNYVGLFQPDGASINLLATAQTLYELGGRASVSLEQEAPVIGISRQGSTFTVSTAKGTFVAPKLIITPGPYADAVFRMLGFTIQATYWNMASAFYRVTTPGIEFPTWFVFQEPVGDNGNEFYGFPEVSWNYPGYVRVASDFVIEPLQSPSQRTPIPNPKELAYTAQWVRDHMTGLDPTPAYTSTCLMALSTIPNKELLLDFAPPYVPGSSDIVIYATGWAGKFIPLLGRILSDLALDGHTPFDISHFMLGDTFFRPLAAGAPDPDSDERPSGD
jgi:glycine/D-amino acid oxidase-like deaminating enzyme